MTDMNPGLFDESKEEVCAIISRAFSWLIFVQRQMTNFDNRLIVSFRILNSPQT